MRKGVILEVGENDVTLITPNGEFMRSKKLQQEYKIGEEVLFYPLELEGKRKRKPSWIIHTLKGRAAILAVAVVFFVATLYPLYEGREVYAYMSIDVNPSIELGLNEELNVVSMKGYNDEGKQILKNIDDWKNHSAVVVADKIIDEIENQGYLTETKNVLISTVPSETSKDKDVKEEVLGKTITKIKKASEKEKIEVTVVNGTIEERETALKQGITTGKYKREIQSKSLSEQKEGKENKTQPQDIQPNTQMVTPVNKDDAGTNVNSDSNNKGQKVQKERDRNKKDKQKQNNDNLTKKQINPGQSKKLDEKEQKNNRAKIDKENKHKNDKQKVNDKNNSNKNRGKQVGNNKNDKQPENRGKQVGNNGNKKQPENRGNQVGNNGKDKRAGDHGKGNDQKQKEWQRN